MGYFGTDKNADHVISALREEQIELVKCKKIEGENGYSRCTLEDGDRVFLDYNEGGVRADIFMIWMNLTWNILQNLIWYTVEITVIWSHSFQRLKQPNFHYLLISRMILNRNIMKK